ncbi:chromosome segregation protein ParM [Streptomyces sp. NPDC058664]|uniref:chromosome segregation protein ParM n=1 Tax=unclassified Streptomyces TaxID=2593676 RepID=UPI00364A9894
MSTPRSVVLERLAYTLAAPVLAVAPNLYPDSPVNQIVQLAGAAGIGGWILAAKSDEHGAGRKILRWSPLVLAAAIDTAAGHTTGFGPYGLDALLAATWAAAGYLVMPFSRHARRRHRPALAAPAPQMVAAEAPEPAAVVDDGADLLTRDARVLWERAGMPARTHIVTVTRHPAMRNDYTLLLRASETGRPITGLSEAAVAAAFYVHEDDVAFSPVAIQPGRQGGPGWLEVHITPDANQRRRTKPTDQEKWTGRVGSPKGGAPGSELVHTTRDDERGVTFYRAKMTDSTDTPRIDLPKVCRALGLPEDDSRVFVLIEGAEFLISVFDTPPLSPTFPATRELLTPDTKTGMYVCGFSITGQPVHNFVFQHDKNAAKHGLVLGVTRGGKTQFFAVTMVAESNAGQIVWLSSCFKDEKTTALGEFIDRQGITPIYMARQLRAAKALCEIRAEMPWAHDGKPHDYKPGDPRCPYKQLNVYADEFMTASQDSDYGEFIQADGDALTVMGLKYGIGFNPAGQSPFAHNGFSTEMKDNLRQNSRPVIFNMGSPGATRKAAEGTMENAYDVPTIPARYAPKEGSAIERAMAGEAEPENGVSTGGVAVVVLDNGRAVLMKALYVDFDTDLADLFPSEVNRLTDYEISELEKRGLWFDWSEPEPRPGEFWPESKGDGDDDGGSRRRGGGKGGGGKRGPKSGSSRESQVISPRQALEAIKSLNNV